MNLSAAVPYFKIGDEVRYIDHYKREIEGTVLAITANWRRQFHGYMSISYTLTHPTFRNREMTVSEKSITELTPIPKEADRLRKSIALGMGK